MKNQKPTTRCPDCGGVHGDDVAVILNMVKAIRLAPDEALGALCASIIDAHSAHYGAMQNKERRPHAKMHECQSCQPAEILGAIIDDFAPISRRKITAMVMKELKNRKAETGDDEPPVMH